MAITVELVSQIIEKIAPKRWAEEWDNVGLLVGDGASPVERILITLDGTAEVISEAKEFGAQLIVAHHPIMLKPLKNLRADNPDARLPLLLLQHKIAYYAAHSNLDQSILSPSWSLGDLLALENMKPLVEAPPASQGDPGAQGVPAVQEASSGPARQGYGVIGYLPEPEKLGVVWRDFLRVINQLEVCSNQEELELAACHLAGDPEKLVRKVAIVNGSGSSFLPQALFQGADFFITGDVNHHAALDALDRGMAVGDLGHFVSEAPMMQALYHYLTAEQQLDGVGIKVSNKNRLPWVNPNRYGGS